MAERLQPFRERIGAIPPPPLQVTSLAPESVAAICNELDRIGEGLDRENGRMDGYFTARGRIAELVLLDCFHVFRQDLAVDNRRRWYNMFDRLRAATDLVLLEAVEKTVKAIGKVLGTNAQFACEHRFNRVFLRANVGYRFANGVLTPITNETEMTSVANASEQANRSNALAVANHLSSAARLLRAPDADYRNSIKESISAVEAAAWKVTGQKGAKLSDCLKQLEHEGRRIHPALSKGWSQLYGWTSDDSGIRHALSDQPTVELRDALYMLVSCSAFVSYLLNFERCAEVK